MKELTIDELKYIKNLISVSGDMGCSYKIGDMQNMINCKELYNKIQEIING